LECTNKFSTEPSTYGQVRVRLSAIRPSQPRMQVFIVRIQLVPGSASPIIVVSIMITLIVADATWRT